MDIAFLSCIYPQCMEDKYIKSSKIMPQFAAHAFQTKLIKGIELILNKPITLINLVPIGDYPFANKILYVRRYNWAHSEGARDINLSYLNLYGIRQFSRKKAVLKELLRWANIKNDQKKVVIAYAAITPFLYAMYHVKKIDPKISTCLIVPDLPQYMNMSPSLIYRLLKSFDIKEQKKYYRFVDFYVLFSKHMLDYFGEDIKYIIMEAIVDYERKFETEQKIDDEKKIIFYSGSLDKKYGIEKLLQAFSYINDSKIELHICGDGNAVSEINKAVLRDRRIRYFGVLPREKVIEMQKRASLLVNPRPNNMAYTKYSFPSKTIEYMETGIPVLMFKLDGIPEEYDEYLYYFESGNPVDMAEQMKHVLSRDRDIGKKAVEFVHTTKNNIIQAKRLIKLIEKGDAED